MSIEITEEERELLKWSSSGRKSDPRMDRAVVLCLRNPKIDRFDALVGGGFFYPRPKEAHVPQMRLQRA